MSEASTITCNHPDHHQHGDFHTHMDLELAISSIKGYYADFIAADRYLAPRLSIYHGPSPTLTITGRAYDVMNVQDKHRCIMEMFYMVPSINPGTTILSFGQSVKFTDGLRDSIVIIALNRSGALTEACPWIYDEDGTVGYDTTGSVDPNGTESLYSAFIKNMMPVFVRMSKVAWPPSDIIQYLADRGHEVELHGDYTLSNLDPRTHI